MASLKQAINKTKKLINNDKIKKRFAEVIKHLENNEVMLNILRINLVKAFCEVEFFMFDMAEVLREEKKYSSETQNTRGAVKQEKNPILPEYRGMVAEYKRYQEILEIWVKEASNNKKPMTKDEKDEFSKLEQSMKENS